MPQSIETQTNPAEKYVHHIIELAQHQVRDSPEYIELRGRNSPHPQAFRKVAEHVASNTENELNDADRALLRVVGNLGVFVQAQHELSSIYTNAGNRRLDDDERWVTQNLKQEYVIPFNHHLKEFINTHPNDEIRTVSSALTNAYGTIFSRYDCLSKEEIIYDESPNPKEIFSQIQATVDGMRHEVAAETMIEAAGFTYDHEVSASEDAHGNDLFIYLESGWEGFDVKASQNSAETHHATHRFSRAVWTGLDWGDFKGIKGTSHGALSIPYAVAEEKSNAFISNIYDMVADIKTQRSLAALKSGKFSVNR